MLQSSMKLGVNRVASGIDRRRPMANEPYTWHMLFVLLASYTNSYTV